MTAPTPNTPAALAQAYGRHAVYLYEERLAALALRRAAGRAYRQSATSADYRRAAKAQASYGAAYDRAMASLAALQLERSRAVPQQEETVA